jgi:hypothetical protein
MNQQLIEIASWRIVTELYRRYPGEFRVIETHPGGGQYDCLSLYDERDFSNLAHFNRGGSLFIHRTKQRMEQIWEDLLNAPNPKAILDTICQMLGYSKVSKMPPSTPTTLVYRFIATFLTHAAFGIQTWECRSGIIDTSGYGGGIVKDFERFPQAQKRVEVRMDRDLLDEPAYRFWFLKKNGKPLICLETTGHLWIRDELKTYDLVDIYNLNHRRIWATVVATVGSLMP